MTPEDDPARKQSTLDGDAFLNVEGAFKGFLYDKALKNQEFMAAHTKAPLFSVMVQQASGMAKR